MFEDGITEGSAPSSIAEGPADGGTPNLYFTEPPANQVGQITTAGVVTEYPIPVDFGSPAGITLGTDGNLWVTENLTLTPDLDSPTPVIVGLSPTGTVVAAYELPLSYSGAQLGQIAEGPDGAFWFTISTSTGGTIGRVTTSGAVLVRRDPQRRRRGVSERAERHRLGRGRQRRPLVHRPPATTPSARSRRRARSPSSPRASPPRTSPTRSRPTARATSGSPTRPTPPTRSGRSPPPA